MHDRIHIGDSLLMQLLDLRDPLTGVWTGELASSALSTALAAVALADGDEADSRLAAGGAAWLVAHVNPDGGWGDTPESGSNLSASLISLGALRALKRCGAAGGPACEAVMAGAEAWLAARLGGAAAPERIVCALREVYGDDRTFAVPILAFLAMCDDTAEAWLRVPPLPFAAALLPQPFYRFFRLQVVSYAMPALIAVGLCRHLCVARARGRRPWGRWLAGTLLRRLERLQPAHGGFLDAIPLTAFVCLALRHADFGNHPVAHKCRAFLRQSVRPTGSWAIDSNLRVWMTSLATRAVIAAREVLPDGATRVARAELERIAYWLLSAQTARRHPFTGAAPGGWAWTDLPGGVPDADDTAGALVALKRVQDEGGAVKLQPAVRAGLRWLLALQNRDGGVPTFCRGWGRLPFDRSCPDISAHALAAWAAWRDDEAVSHRDRRRLDAAMRRAADYLKREQHTAGCWLPLWFGHQDAERGRNPVVGTARVVDALRAARIPLAAAGRAAQAAEMLAAGERWLVQAQQPDGGWSAGACATTEETALAVIALAGAGKGGAEAARRGQMWLVARGLEAIRNPSPIGLYFSLLWYHERLYPLIWALEALAVDDATRPRLLQRLCPAQGVISSAQPARMCETQSGSCKQQEVSV